MRRVRWLILAAILIITLLVGISYMRRLALFNKNAPAAPQPLETGIDASAEGFRFRKHDEHKRGPDGQPCPIIEVAAKRYRQITAPVSYELTDADIKIFNRQNCGATFNHVVSGKAKFEKETGLFFSEGEVTITMNIKYGETPGDDALRVTSSGVSFESKTGKVFTGQPASFTFGGTNGRSIGADYDPNNHQIHMKNQVEVNTTGKDGTMQPMKVEAGDLVYFENDNKVRLTPWSRLTRGPLKLDGGEAWITIEDERVREVSAEKASGVEDQPGRKVEFGADHMTVSFNEESQVSKITGDGSARSLSTTPKGRNETRADRFEMIMAATDDNSHLDRVTMMGHASLKSIPAAPPKATPPAARVLESEIVEIQMRPGGEEIQYVETHAPGTLEFIPAAPGEVRRVLTGDPLRIVYRDDNQVESFHARKVTTRTERPPKDGKPQPPAETSSDEFQAEFDTDSNEVARIDQKGHFRYREGDRTAQSDRAILDQTSDKITLSGNAHMTDVSGSATADTIVLDRATGDFVADGRVNSTRLPDKKGTGSAMLSTNEPVQAKADKMSSAEENAIIVYEGHAQAWQGANRILADRIEIDREKGIVRAQGNVMSQVAERKKNAPGAKPAAPVFTIVNAPAMVYTEESHLAHYTGGCVMTRGGMVVEAREIRAYLSADQGGSSLDHAFADGAVSVVQSSPGRTRTGTAEHAEYYAADGKMVLTGGQPRFADSTGKITRGRVLTYYSAGDRLLVNGVENEPGQSTIKK